VRPSGSRIEVLSGDYSGDRGELFAILLGGNKVLNSAVVIWREAGLTLVAGTRT